MYFIYSLLLAAALILLSPYFFIKGLRTRKYLHNLPERLGRVPPQLHQSERGAIWVHAVSVGEALAVAPLMNELRRRFPERKLLVSTTTRTGQEVASRRLGADGTFYFPLDFAFACRRTLRAVKPELVILAETELWPHFLRESQRARTRVVLVNGRISDRSFARYRFWRYFLREILERISLFLMQTEQDADRIRQLGAPADRVAVGGNLKFDLPVPTRPDFLPELEQCAKGRPILVAGSTVAGEEALLLDALEMLRRLYDIEALAVLAPRHPERFDEVARLLGARGLPFLRRSQGWRAEYSPAVVLLDSLGELAGTYAAATVAFVGGSLVPAGGHNPIEPALAGKPVVFGPHMQNFRSVARALIEERAGFQVRSSQELAILLAALMGDREAVARAGQAARSLVERERGATRRSADKIIELLRAEWEPAQASTPSVP
jgi:3-deoxy-D-manno-octulosonic-acid transferase